MEINKLYLSLFGLTLMITLVILENYFPERDYKSNLKKRSSFTNLLAFGFNNIILITFNVTAVYLVAYNYRFHDTFNLLPIWGQAILGIILLDFFIWVWHLANHKIKFLWRFHKVHHSEKYLNATSSLRFHLGELLLSIVIKSTILFTLGISFWVFAIHEVMVTFFATFHHSNLKLPQHLQRIIELFIISPDMHRTHHSTLRDEHDSNYGVIFSWWDILFKTFNSNKPNQIGLSGVPEKNIFQYLVFPFKK